MIVDFKSTLLKTPRLQGEGRSVFLVRFFAHEEISPLSRRSSFVIRNRPRRPFLPGGSGLLRQIGLPAARPARRGPP